MIEVLLQGTVQKKDLWNFIFVLCCSVSPAWPFAIQTTYQQMHVRSVCQFLVAPFMFSLFEYQSQLYRGRTVQCYFEHVEEYIYF